jgi:hypothetical protein
VVIYKWIVQVPSQAFGLKLSGNYKRIGEIPSQGFWLNLIGNLQMDK